MEMEYKKAENELIIKQRNERYEKLISGDKSIQDINVYDLSTIYDEYLPGFSCGFLSILNIDKEKEVCRIECNVYLSGGAGYKTHEKEISFYDLKWICFKPPSGLFGLKRLFWKLWNRKELALIGS